jgi:NADH:ubiquinone oxidoreductase subunit 6 (subunit J)
VTGDLIFYAFAALTVVSAIFVAFSQNIVHAGFSLLFTLFGVAGLYAILGADFLAVAQLIVYVGGILVLVLFTVMMTRIPKGQGTHRGLDRMVAPGILALVILAIIYMVITQTDWPVVHPAPAKATTAQIGTEFMTNYIFPFEFASLLLLAAMIGAAILIREFRAPVDDALDESAAAGDSAAPAATSEQEEGHS